MRVVNASPFLQAIGLGNSFQHSAGSESLKKGPQKMPRMSHGLLSSQTINVPTKQAPVGEHVAAYRVKACVEESIAINRKTMPAAQVSTRASFCTRGPSFLLPGTCTSSCASPLSRAVIKTEGAPASRSSLAHVYIGQPEQSRES